MDSDEEVALIVRRVFKHPFVIDPVDDSFVKCQNGITVLIFNKEFTSKISLANRQKFVDAINGKKVEFNFNGVRFTRVASNISLANKRIFHQASLDEISRKRQLTPKIAGIMRMNLTTYIVNQLNKAIA